MLPSIRQFHSRTKLKKNLPISKLFTHTLALCAFHQCFISIPYLVCTQVYIVPGGCLTTFIVPYISVLVSYFKSQLRPSLFIAEFSLVLCAFCSVLHLIFFKSSCFVPGSCHNIFYFIAPYTSSPVSHLGLHVICCSFIRYSHVLFVFCSSFVTYPQLRISCKIS